MQVVIPLGCGLSDCIYNSARQSAYFKGLTFRKDSLSFVGWKLDKKSLCMFPYPPGGAVQDGAQVRHPGRESAGCHSRIAATEMVSQPPRSVTGCCPRV